MHFIEENHAECSVKGMGVLRRNSNTVIMPVGERVQPVQAC